MDSQKGQFSTLSRAFLSRVEAGSNIWHYQSKEEVGQQHWLEVSEQPGGELGEQGSSKVKKWAKKASQRDLLAACWRATLARLMGRPQGKYRQSMEEIELHHSS